MDEESADDGAWTFELPHGVTIEVIAYADAAVLGVFVAGALLGIVEPIGEG